MKKNILHVFSGEYKTGNGIFTVIDSLFNTINKNNYNCTLYCPAIKGNCEKINYKLIDSNKNTFGDVLSSENYNLVVFHGVYFIDYLIKFFLCKKNNIPYFIKPHGSLVEASLHKGRFKKIVFLKLGLKYFLNNSSGIFYINNEEEKNSIKLKAISYIEPNLIRIETKFKKTESEKVRFLFFSRIDFNHKGLDFLLDGLNKIKNEFRDGIVVEFYGIGNEKPLKKLKDFITNNNLEFVKFKGAVYTESEKIAMFSKSDILLLTSRYEGYPTVITEALSFGVPPIVTPGTNALFLSENNIGWRSELDSTCIANTMEKALVEFNENRSSIPLKCIDYVQNNFNTKKDIIKIENLYKKLVNK